MRRAISVLFIAVAAAFTLAACGGDEDSPPPTKAEYKQEYTALSKDLAAAGATVSKAVTQSSGKSNEELKKRFADAAEQTREIADDFENSTPPDDATIQTQIDKLVAGLRVAAEDLDNISEAAGKKDGKAAAEAAAKLTRDNAGVANPKIALDEAILGIKPPTATTSTTTTKKK